MKDLKSKIAYQKASKYIPGGVNSPVRAFRNIGRNPLFIKRASGALITDIDDNTYIDYCLSWGVHILGHKSEQINKAVRNVLKNGTSYGAPTLLETELAERIIGAIPSIKKMRFVNSGTEAVMSAVRLARAFTKRNIIVKFDGCYHGHADYLLVSGGSGLSELKKSSSAGVPQDFIKQTISIPFNNQPLVESVFNKYKGKIAAVIVEPVPANMGVILPNDNFLQFLRKITKANDTLLIFDEVITGFRLKIDGAQGYFGVIPDITCLGKIIGGGLPVGAFGGRIDIMDLLAPDGPVYQAGTLSGNPLAMSAGIAVLKEISKKGFYERLNSIADDFTKEVRKMGLNINAIGSMFSVFFSKGNINNYSDLKKCDTIKFAGFYNNLLKEGIYLSPSQGETNFISIKHNPIILRKTLCSIRKYK
ncbi:MAG: glutamate-1-semialdehyde 2,1-aminomutase [Elusimicrobia bacterium]|nr:glutamate-1-semialdehyde 2,1-aminomutase [Elusimicrobiota bacterium]